MSAIELHDITKRYGLHTVLDNYNIVIEQGSLLAITGKSGSGKSTLLNIMGLLEKPDSGSVSICGENHVAPNTKKSMLLLRNKIGYLFQNFALIENETIGQNLEVALMYSNKTKDEKDKAKREALEAVKINSILGQRIHELSGGEQQRVAIARLMLKPCELILADEPTGSLDEENRNIAMGLLNDLNAMGKTIVIVTHDPYIASQCTEHISL